MTTVPNDISDVIEADRAHVWHHLIQHKPFESIDPRVMVEGTDAEAVRGHAKSLARLIGDELGE